MKLDHDSLLLLSRSDVEGLLEGREAAVIEVAAGAYAAHDLGDSALPHSVFLRFPGDARDRIIALPAYLGGATHSAGIKWIASFPGNLDRGLERASALIALNSIETGRPLAVLEGSVISAWRTAASASLAARQLLTPRSVVDVAFIGCGLINATIARLLRPSWRRVGRVTLFDLEPSRARRFATACRKSLDPQHVRIAASVAEALAAAPLISIATTATAPHIESLEPVEPGGVVLHISLRDLAADAVLSAENVVDDVDHVCRAATSLELAERRAGHREFIRCTIGQLLNGRATLPARRDKPLVFSPFGLGVLDIAVARWVVERAQQQAVGVACNGFFRSGSGGAG